MKAPDYTSLHGHIIARPDGIRVACHGIRLCRHCQGERAALDAIGPAFDLNVQRVRQMSAALIFSRRWRLLWKSGARHASERSLRLLGECRMLKAAYEQVRGEMLDEMGRRQAAEDRLRDGPPAHEDDCALHDGFDCDCKELLR